MLFSQTHNLTLSPSATFISGLIVFKDHTIVISDVKVLQKTTTLRYFQQSQQKHSIVLEGILSQFINIRDKQLMVKNQYKAQILIINFENQPKITIFQQNELINKSMIKTLVFFETQTYILHCQQNGETNSTILFFNYPAQLIHKHELQLQRRLVIKLNQIGDIGIYNNSLTDQFVVQTVNFDTQISEIHNINFHQTVSVRDIRKYKKDKLLFLLSNVKYIGIFDCFTKTYETLVDIATKIFSSQTIDSVNNFIYNWFPLNQHFLILARNTKPQPIDRIYVCSYDGKMICSHPAKIDSYHGYQSRLHGKQHVEYIYKYKGQTCVKVIEWQLVPAKNMQTFLAIEGLGLDQQMFQHVINKINYD